MAGRKKHTMQQKIKKLDEIIENLRKFNKQLEEKRNTEEIKEIKVKIKKLQNQRGDQVRKIKEG